MNMARTRLVDAPPKNDVYTGMLALTCFAMLIGIIALVLELSGDYGFEAEAKGGPSISLPKDFSRPVPKNTTPTPSAPMTRAEPEAPKVAPPVIATAPEPAPLPKLAVEVPKATPTTPPAAPTSVPSSTPKEVRPGFNPRFPQ
jgi:hypothetical protein